MSWFRDQLDAEEANARREYHRLTGQNWPSSSPLDGAVMSRHRIAANVQIRRLRTVAAHRAIVARHEPYDVTAREDDGRIVVLAVCCSYCIGDVTTADNEPWPCPDVRDIVSIYEDRPGFDPSWRPE